MENFKRKGYILYDSHSMAFWKKQNVGDSKKMPVVGCQRLEVFERHTDRTQILGY